jgi:poly-gamma-glutamate capsule biosynthesis protein CapA/YwtB (metallophosphatase superfamily)
MSLNQPICIFFCGDVMTGRGIDQILPYPGNPVLYESYVRDAREYVAIAEAVNGPIPRPVDFAYIWGDALEELDSAGTDLRIVNLETSITVNEEAWLNKPVHYRMNPANVGCITAARIDCCSLANNHTLDWGYQGLAETMATLDKAGVARTGAGRNRAEAASPAILDVLDKGHVLVFGLGSITSGIPWSWGATEDRPGINLLADLSEDAARRVAGEVRRLKGPGVVAVVSIHWGGNWGFPIPSEQVEFAHRLVDEGVDVVHGHSSHHVKSIEVYRHRLILYGCGDFLTDYEGIHGFEEFRSDLNLMYLTKLDSQGKLEELRIVPMQMKRFRLNRAPAADAQWLRDQLNDLGSPFGTSVHLKEDNSLALQWH